MLLLSSYKRPIYLTNQIHNFLNQNYDSNYFDFSVSIKGISRDVLHHLVLPNLSPLIDKKRLTLSYDKNKDQFTNLLNTYRNIDISNYDYLCKIDDDDFYSAHYLSTINTLIHILINPDFLTSGSLTSLKPANDLFLKKGTTEFIGATICFSKNFAQDLLDIESKTSAQYKIYEDAFINKIATHTNKKYLYLTPLTHFIYNQTTQSIMRPNQ